MSNAMSPPKAGAKPKNCPPGTLPIDETDLDHDTIDKIKKGVDASPSDWVGIAPDGTVVTGDEGGNAVDNGPAQSWVPWSIRK